MVQNTLSRIETLVAPMNSFIVTNKLQYDFLLKQLPFFPKENILVEPVGRNTAPCIALAASWIQRIDSTGLMMVLPADHIIRDQEKFLKVLRVALKVAEETDGLLTIGIKPNRPETGYGYIQFTDDGEGSQNPYRTQGVFRVKTFAEKPNLETAEKFLASGDFLWNSGIFVWKASSILKEIQMHLPETYEQISLLQTHIGTPEYKQALQNTYGLIRGISIDYGVMEKARNVFVVRGDFGWSDVGSWDEVVNLTAGDAEGNSLKGNVIVKDSRGNYIDAGNTLVAVISVEEMIVVATDDAILICKKGQSQDVKEIVDYIRRKKMHEYL